MYVHSIETRFGRVKEHIENIFSECAQMLSASPDNFDALLKRAGVILHTGCEDLDQMGNFIAFITPVIAKEEELIGETFVADFYEYITRLLACPELVKSARTTLLQSYPELRQRIELLKKYMHYLTSNYTNAYKHQYAMLPQFKDLPGAYFDIDQRKVSIVLAAHPKLRRKEKAGAPAAEDESKDPVPAKWKPVILLNSKRLTPLQMERFPHNTFLSDTYPQEEEEGKRVHDPNLEKMEQILAAEKAVVILLFCN